MDAREGRLIAVEAEPDLRFATVLEEVWSSGDAVLPLDPRAPRYLVDAILEETRPAALRTAEGETPLDDPVPIEAGVALVGMTSGSVGVPKGVELAHASLAASVRGGLERLGATHGDRWLCCLPLHHVAGILVHLRARELGTLPIVHPRFVAEAVAEETSATHVALVPTMLARLLDIGADLSRYETILLGGGPAGSELLERAAHAGGRVVVSYGMTETAGGCVYDGVPLDGVEVKVRDDGRIAVRGPVVMRGYRNRSDLTAEALRDGWLVTGDLGEWDDGRLRVLGRADDVVVTGGEKVSGGAVAAVIVAHHKVRDVVVQGRPDTDLGERIVAIVVPADPGDPPTLEELRTEVGARLGRHAAPRGLELVDVLPGGVR